MANINQVLHKSIPTVNSSNITKRKKIANRRKNGNIRYAFYIFLQAISIFPKKNPPHNVIQRIKVIQISNYHE